MAIKGLPDGSALITGDGTSITIPPPDAAAIMAREALRVAQEPPAIRDVNLPATLVEARDKALKDAGALVIRDEESFRLAEIAYTDLKTIERRVESTRQQVMRPILEDQRAVQELYQPSVNALATAAKELGQRIAKFREDAAAAAREAAALLARQQREAAEAARQASQEAMRAGDVEAAQDHVLEAWQLDAPILPPRVMGMSSGLSTAKGWKVDDEVDLLALVKAAAANPEAFLSYVSPNLVALRARARADKERFNVPGVRAYAEGSARARTK